MYRICYDVFENNIINILIKTTTNKKEKIINRVNTTYFEKVVDTKEDVFIFFKDFIFRE